MSCFMSVAVSAATVEPVSPMRADPCPLCQTGNLRSKGEYDATDWMVYDYELCTHGGAVTYNDRLERKEVYTYFECDNKNCGYGETSGRRYVYRVYCAYTGRYYY